MFTPIVYSIFNSPGISATRSDQSITRLILINPSFNRLRSFAVLAVMIILPISSSDARFTKLADFREISGIYAPKLKADTPGKNVRAPAKTAPGLIRSCRGITCLRQSLCRHTAWRPRCRASASGQASGRRCAATLCCSAASGSSDSRRGRSASRPVRRAGALR